MTPDGGRGVPRKPYNSLVLIALASLLTKPRKRKAAPISMGFATIGYAIMLPHFQED